MPSASPILHSLRQSIAKIGRDGTRVMSTQEDNRASLGHEKIDAALGGGLMRGALHEVCPCSPLDHAAATGFALALIACLADKRDWIWIRQGMAEREKGRPYGPGLKGFGLDPFKLLDVTTRDTQEALKAAEESLRCAALGAALCEPWGETKALDLTATRRLTLAAETSGVPLILLGDSHRELSTAARTKWSIAAVPSASAFGPGAPRFSVELVLNRQSQAQLREGIWMTEWCHGERVFKPADSVGDLSLSRDRQDYAPRKRSRRAAG